MFKYVESLGIQMLFVGIENQTKVDQDMVIRMMGYDYEAYRSQIDHGEHRYPVISVALYFGKKPWNGPKSLSEIAEISGKCVEKFCDYRINLIEMQRLPKKTWDKLTSDFKLIADYFAELKTFYETHRNVKVKHPVELANFFRVFTGDRRFAEVAKVAEIAEKEGRDVRMCEMLDELENKGRAEGSAEGSAEGRVEGSDRMARLITCLIQVGRSGDVEKMARDPEYREMLFVEFGI